MTSTNIYQLIIPKNIFLYRKAKNNMIEPTMFFSLETFGVNTNSDNLYAEPIQVWKTNENINTHFFVKGLLPFGKYESSIGDYYFEFCGDTELCDGQIKCRENKNRINFLSWLTSNFKIESWVTTIDSVDNKIEFFSFSLDISKKLSFIKYINKDTYENSFKKEMIKDEIPLLKQKTGVDCFTEYRSNRYSQI